MHIAYHLRIYSALVQNIFCKLKIVYVTQESKLNIWHHLIVRVLTVRRYQNHVRTVGFNIVDCFSSSEHAASVKRISLSLRWMVRLRVAVWLHYYELRIAMTVRPEAKANDLAYYYVYMTLVHRVCRRRKSFFWTASREELVFITTL